MAPFVAFDKVAVKDSGPSVKSAGIGPLVRQFDVGLLPDRGSSVVTRSANRAIYASKAEALEVIQQLSVAIKFSGETSLPNRVLNWLNLVLLSSRSGRECTSGER